MTITTTPATMAPEPTRRAEVETANVQTETQRIIQRLGWGPAPGHLTFPLGQGEKERMLTFTVDPKAKSHVEWRAPLLTMGLGEPCVQRVTCQNSALAVLSLSALTRCRLLLWDSKQNTLLLLSFFTIIHFIFYFFILLYFCFNFLLNLLEWLVIKLYRFKVYNSIIYMICIVLCVHHPKSRPCPLFNNMKVICSFCR